MKISKWIRPVTVIVASLATTTVLAWSDAHTHQLNSGTQSQMNGSFGFNMSLGGSMHGNAGSVPRPVILRGVNFKFDSAELTLTSKNNLDSVATVLSKHSGNKLDVGGHASAEGDAMYNLALSTRRARAVRNYLIEQGVTPASLSSTGYGEMHPIANNNDEQGRSINRRVDLSPTPVAF